MTFHNPYHFVPAMPRSRGGDPPVGHDRLYADRWTGRLTVTLTTVTPMLIPDVGTESGGHRTFGTRVVEVDGQQRVYLPPTSVKGALRSAYEAVTNSRMGVFGHTTPLGYRPDAGVGVEPVLVSLGPDGAPVGALGCLWLNYANDHRMMRPMAVPTYRPASPCRYPNNAEPRHGDKVSAWVELVDHDGTYRYWRVVSIWRSGIDEDQPRPAELGTDARASRKHTPLGPGALVRGFLHRTNANIERKHDERLFALECVQSDQGVTVEQRRKLDIDPAVWASYRSLIKDYRAQHATERRDDIWGRTKQSGAKAKPWESYQDINGTVYAWSRHLYDIPSGQGPDALPAGTFTTCYAQCVNDTITELRPVLISRRLHENAPDTLVPDGVLPADALDELSPADRVFGWVWQTRREDAEEERDSAVRGALRVGPVLGPPADQALERLGEGIALEILSAPKPSQGRFYTATARPGGVPTPLPRDAAKESFFGAGRVIRGRKVYPHQRGTQSPGYWSPDREGQEFRRAAGTRDSQNRTVTSWVRAGQEFTFTVDVRNLSALELGALLWLLEPDRFGGAHPGRHRMGGGKPFGFGSVELRLAETGHDLRLGSAWADDFTSLGNAPTPGDKAWRVLAAEFESTLLTTTAGRVVLEAVRAFATGFSEDMRVHYPRLTPAKDPNGENYKWFVHNEKKRQLPGGRGKRKDAESLPAFGTPLPYDTAPPDERGRAPRPRRT